MIEGQGVSLLELLIHNQTTILAWIAAIGTAAMAVVAVFTLQTIKRQQASAHRPWLFPGNTTLSLLTNNHGVPYFRMRDEVKSSGFDFAMHSVALELRNIGLGGAHSVEVHWLYDADQMKQWLLSTGDGSHRILEAGDGLCMYVYGDGPDDYFGFRTTGDTDDHQAIAAITPGESVVFRVPESILNFFAFQSVILLRSKGRVQLSGPDIGLRLEYTDIGTNKVGNQAEVQCEMVAAKRQADHLPIGYLSLEFANSPDSRSSKSSKEWKGRNHV